MYTKRFTPAMLRLAAWVILLIALAFGVTTPRAARAGSIIYVKWNAVGANNGASWANAYTNLQTALAAAVSGDEIWVAAGTYYPGASRAATFQLKSGVEIYGGFNGTETWRNQRAWLVNTTLLSGDIGASGDSSDNSYHVVTGSGVNGAAILDGFTIAFGNANGVSASYGGGINNLSGAPTLRNLTLQSNTAAGGGGGMYNDNASPALSDVKFMVNSATTHGGGMYNWASSPRLTNVTFFGNSANYGGGMYNDAGSHPFLINPSFELNIGNVQGGGMCNDASHPNLYNANFAWNSASYGSGMFNGNNSNPMVVNATFLYNYGAAGGSGMFNDNSNPVVINATFYLNSVSSCDGAIYNSNSSPTVANSILWNNTSPCGMQIYNFGTSAPIVTYSDVEGGYAGVGNIAADPLFVNASGGDLRLQPTSPAIDAGDNYAVPGDSYDLDGDGNTTEPFPYDRDSQPRFVDLPSRPNTGRGTPPIVDMGAYEVFTKIYLPLILR